MIESIKIEKSQTGHSVHNADKLEKFAVKMLSKEERKMLIEMLVASKNK